jgi:hypothetical protein
MADAPEIQNGPPAIDQTGNLTVWAVKTIADINAPKLTEIGAVTSFRITYSFETGGYSLTTPQEKTTDERLTSKTMRESLGKVTPSLSDLTYVASTSAASAAVVLKDGGIWYLVDRRGIAQTAVAAVGDPVRVVRVNLGIQQPGPADGTGKWSLVQAAAVEDVTLAPVLVVA